MKNWILSFRLYVCNHVISHIPSHALRLCYYRRVMRMRIGPGSSIHLGAFVDAPGGFLMGAGSTVNGDCRVDTRGGITIGDNVSISMHVQLLTAEHNLTSPDFEATASPITVHDYVFIGTRAIVMPGVTLGRGSAVAAGAVVTKDVEPGTTVGGIPARVIARRPADLHYDVRYRRPLF